MESVINEIALVTAIALHFEGLIAIAIDEERLEDIPDLELQRDLAVAAAQD